MHVNPEEQVKGEEADALRRILHNGHLSVFLTFSHTTFFLSS